MPIYEGTVGVDPQPRSSAKDTYLHIEGLLKESLKVLPLKDETTEIDYTINRGAAAVLLARLYFNAHTYINEDHYSECETLCNEIMSGTYGDYSMASDWREPFGFNNLNSAENIWVLPSALNKLQNNTYTAWFYQPNMMDQFFGLKGAGTMNGITIMPSHKPNGDLYTDADFKLGRTFARFNDADLRKKCYKYNGNGDYEGQLLFGPIAKNGTPVIVSGQNSVHDGKRSNWWIMSAVRRSSASPIRRSMRFLRPNTKEKRIPAYVLSNTRLLRMTDPNQWKAGFVMARLAEVQYMLAECKWRDGDKGEAARLINDVRKRNFENEVDPDPCTAGNLDEWRMLAEWGIEFLGEGRRRTDLLRWDKFVEADWWDHKATNNPYFKVFPIPNDAISGNPLIEPNPGYGQ